MGSTVTHKFYRVLKTGDQFQLCNGKKVNNKEKGLSYFWGNVDCSRCEKKKGIRRS